MLGCLYNSPVQLNKAPKSSQGPKKRKKGEKRKATTNILIALCHEKTAKHANTECTQASKHTITCTVEVKARLLLREQTENTSRQGANKAFGEKKKRRQLTLAVWNKQLF